jgi:hypothetical protein
MKLEEVIAENGRKQYEVEEENINTSVNCTDLKYNDRL